MSLKSLFNNIKKRGLKDITNLKKIRNYLDADKIEKEGIYLKYEEIIPYTEQLMLRLHHSECKTCVSEGACKHCGCSMPLAATVIDHECEVGNFNKMLTKTEVQVINGKSVDKIVLDVEGWYKYKDEVKLKFLPVYGQNK